MNGVIARKKAICLAILCAVVFLLPVVGPLKYFTVQSWFIRLAFLMLVAPIIFASIFFSQRRIKLSFNPMLAAVLTIVLLAISTATFAISKYDAWVGAVTWILMLLIVISVHNIVKTKPDVRKILLCFGLGGGFVALIGVGQYLFGFEFYLTATLDYSWPSSTLNHKNQAAGFVILTFPIVIYLLRTSKSLAECWLFNFVIALMFAFLVYAFARQSFVALIIQCVALVLIFRFVAPSVLKGQSTFNGNRRLGAALSCILFFFLISMPTFDKPIDLENTAVNRLLYEGQMHYKAGVDLEAASKGRFKTWRTTLKMLPDTWYGVGALNWQHYYPKYNSVSKNNYNLSRSFYWRYTHNDYLQTIVEFGWLSIVAGVLLVFGVYKVCRLSLLHGDSEERYLVFSIVVSLLGLFTVMFFSFPLSMVLQPVYLCVLLGVLSGFYSRWNKQKELRIVFVDRRLVGTFLFLIVGVLGGYLGYRMCLGIHYTLVAESIHKYIEQKLYDHKLYPDVSKYYAQINYLVELSRDMDPYHTRFDMIRGGLLAYLSVNEINQSKKINYLSRSKVFLDNVRRVSPYYAFPDITESQMYKSLGETEKEKVALEKAIKLAPGDIPSVKALAFIYIRHNKFESAFGLLDSFFKRFYDFELLKIYAFVAQQINRQEDGLQRISEIELENFVKPRINKVEFNKNKQQLDELIYALDLQVRSGRSN